MLAIITQNTHSFSYSTSARQVTLDGSTSQDSAGRTILSPDFAVTQFEWLLLSKPEGQPDPAISTSGSMGELATVTFPAGVQGGYLYLLKVYEGTESSSSTFSETPNSALSSIEFRSQYLSLHVLPEGERNHGDRDNANILSIDKSVGELELIVNGIAAVPVATDVVLGKSKLNEANAAGIGDPANPEVVNADGEKFRTLTLGGVATGYHTHPEYAGGGGGGGGGTGTGGRHHHLRPDLLTGSYDKVWSKDNTEWSTATPMLGSITDSIIGAPFRHASVDYNLLVDCYNNDPSLSNQRALTVVKLQDVGSLTLADDIWAVMDLRLQPVQHFDNLSLKSDLAESVGMRYEAMFIGDFYNSTETARRPLHEAYGGSFSLPTDADGIADALEAAAFQNSTVAVGWTMSDWSTRASDFGTHPFNNTFNGDGGIQTILTKQLSQGSMHLEALLGIQLRNGVARTYISLQTGGWVAIGSPVTLPTDFDSVSFYLAGTSGDSTLGLRMETTALRIIRYSQDAFGLYPSYSSSSPSA